MFDIVFASHSKLPDKVRCVFVAISNQHNLRVMFLIIIVSKTSVLLTVLEDT